MFVYEIHYVDFHLFDLVPFQAKVVVHGGGIVLLLVMIDIMFLNEFCTCFVQCILSFS